MDESIARCDAGDEAIGGVGYVKDLVNSQFRNLWVHGGVDIPHKARGRKILDADDLVQAGWEHRVRVNCANTG